MSADNRSNEVVLLGTYWYYNPPADYTYAYIEFRPGHGGHANDEAELRCLFSTSEGEELRTQLEKINETYPCCSFGLTWHFDSVYSVSISSYALLDYDCFVAGQIDHLLRRLNAQPLNDRRREVSSSLSGSNRQTIHYPSIYTHTWPGLTNTNGQLVSGRLANGAEQLKIRVDVHTSHATDTNGFVADLRAVLDASGLMFGYFHQYAGNYVLFVGNGRQGVGGCPLTVSDLPLFADILPKTLSAHHFRYGLNALAKSYDTYGKLISSPVELVKMPVGQEPYILREG